MKIIRFIYEGARMALSAILANKTRSFLTMIGVATGIFAITSILTMVNSMEKFVSDNLSAMGNTNIMVYNWPFVVKDDWRKYLNRPKVSFYEYERLKDNLDDAEGVSYKVSSRAANVSARGQSIRNVQINGITPDEAIVFNFEFASGRYFTDIEFSYGSSVCILGYNVAENLFPDQIAVGKNIRVGSKQLRVIGIMDKSGSDFTDIDDEIYVPYKVASRIFNIRKRYVNKQIWIKASSPETMEYVESETIGIVRAARGLRPSEDNNFSINKAEQIMNEVDNILSYLRTGGWIISLFSILIGGFSIGMIMYISVRERTREIGIQKALGSTRGFILYQFLMESIVICIMGGLIGLIGVYTAGAVANIFIAQADTNFAVSVSLSNIGTAIGLSTFIGLISGVVPAIIASSLDPVKAIRHTG